MSREIKVEAGGVEVAGWLNETDTASRVWNALPITGSMNLWGDEIYFPIPVGGGVREGRHGGGKPGGHSILAAGKGGVYFPGKDAGKQGG